tara:strand:- start:201 stop:473 length:273 start_codon:yes stop_codon:yes gene_type:complete
MCFKFDIPKPMGQPPALASRNPDLTKESILPKAEKVVDEKKVTGVEYGNQKPDVPKEGKATGTESLRVKLNTGTQGNVTGGINQGGGTIV